MRVEARRVLSVLLLTVLLTGALPLAAGRTHSTNGAQPYYLNFGVFDQRISYATHSYDNQQVQNADLGMLVSTGASCVREDIDYGPWLPDNQSYKVPLINNVTGQIRADNKCLIIADAGAEYFRGNPIPWATFKAEWVQRVQTLAQLYQPDYYIVIKEPRWYTQMISDASTNPLVTNVTEWVVLTQQLITAVQAVSPNTKVGVAVDANSLGLTKFSALYTGFLQGTTQLPGLSFIGFDTYGAKDQSTTQSYLSQYGSGGKAVWISEAWSDVKGNPLNGDPSQDAQWMTSMYGFLSQVGASFFIPFFTNDFSSYKWDTNSTDIVNTYNSRQPVFYAFQSLAQSYGLPRSPTVSTALSSSSIVVGGSVSDSASLNNGTGIAGGTVTYDYYSGASCGGAPTLVSQVNVLDGSVPASAAHEFASVGSYSWSAAYSGDSENRAAVSACEPLTVTPASPAISASLSSSGIVIGQSASDSATLTGAFNATGTVTFQAYQDSSCSSQVYTDTAALAGNSASSGQFSPASVGTYYWVAAYSGDASNNPVSTSCQAAGQTLSVALIATTATVNCSPSSVPVNAETTCTATVSNTDGSTYSTPSGTVVFSSGAGNFSSSGCSLSGSGATAACQVTYSPALGAAGSQTIGAGYLGDSYHGSSSATTTVTAVKRTTSATVSCSPMPHNTKRITCTVTVTDTSPGTAAPPTGTVKLTIKALMLSSSARCTLSGSGAASSCTATFTLIRIGSYTVNAVYAGDANHSTSKAVFKGH